MTVLTPTQSINDFSVVIFEHDCGEVCCYLCPCSMIPASMRRAQEAYPVGRPDDCCRTWIAITRFVLVGLAECVFDDKAAETVAYEY